MASSNETRLSVSMVLVQCEDTLKKHLDVNKVTQMMLIAEKADEILKKSTKKQLEKSRRKDTKYLLAVLKKYLEFPGFVLLLESLEKIGDENHLTALTTIATHIEYLSIPTLADDPLIAEATKKLRRIHDIHFKPTKHLDVPPDPELSQSSETLTVTESESQPVDDHAQPIEIADLSDAEQPGQEGMRETQSESVCSYSIQSLPQSIVYSEAKQEFVHIGRNGGQLYSPVHGITVSVPASAVVKEFELQMTASLNSTIPISSDYLPCSAIVTLTTHPKIEDFSDFVTVSVPHCAVGMQDYPEFYCILSHTDGQSSFVEDTDIEVDFTSQWRYFSFKTKHFTKYLSAGKRNAKVTPPVRKQPLRLAKQKAKSLEHDHNIPEVESVLQAEFRRSMSDPLAQSRCRPDVRFCLGMFSPLRKEGSMWKVVFLTCPDQHTGYTIMEQDAVRLLGLDGIHSLEWGSPRYSCVFREGSSAIEFSPTEYSGDGWSITALKTPAVITRTDMVYGTVEPRKETSYAPHGLTYAVRKETGATVSLCQKLAADGILVYDCDRIISGNVSFTLAFESVVTYSAVSGLFLDVSSSYITEELYDPTSKLLSALREKISLSAVKLSLDNPETMIFTAELSFCMISKWCAVAKLLSLHDYEIKNLEAYYSIQKQEAAFQVILTWLRNSHFVNLQHLIDALDKSGIVIHVQKLTKTMYHHREKYYYQLSRSIVAEISKRIASQWKFIGRMLGMTENYINLAASQGDSGIEGHYKLMEQTVAMLEQWQKVNGNEATLLKLKNAIYAVHEHSGHQLMDAVDFLSRPFIQE